MRRLSLSDTIFYNLGDCYMNAVAVLDGPCDLAVLLAEMEGVIEALPALTEQSVRVGMWTFAKRSSGPGRPCQARLDHPRSVDHQLRATGPAHGQAAAQSDPDRRPAVAGLRPQSRRTGEGNRRRAAAFSALHAGPPRPRGRHPRPSDSVADGTIRADRRASRPRRAHSGRRASRIRDADHRPRSRFFAAPDSPPRHGSRRRLERTAGGGRRDAGCRPVAFPRCPAACAAMSGGRVSSAGADRRTASATI